MYINAYKETNDNLHLIKGQNPTYMLAYEIEKIFEKEDVCETAQEFLPKLKEIKQFADLHAFVENTAAFIWELKDDVHLETNGFKFIIENTQYDRIWISIEYTHYDVYNLDDITYTSVIEHIDDID